MSHPAEATALCSSLARLFTIGYSTSYRLGSKGSQLFGFTEDKTNKKLFILVLTSQFH